MTKARNVVIMSSDSYRMDGLLVLRLMDLGLDVYVARGGDFYTEVGRYMVRAQRVEHDGSILDGTITEVLDLENDVCAVKARGRLLKGLDEVVSTINGSRLRGLSSDKWAQCELLRDYIPETVPIGSEDERMFDEDDSVVLKANDSFGKKYVQIGKSSEFIEMRDKIAGLLVEGQDKRIIAQKYVKGDAWGELKSFDDYSDERLKVLGRELRIYVFGLGAKVDMFAVARLVEDDDEQWIYVNQDSVPSRVWGVAQDATERIFANVGVQYGYLAVDVIKHEGEIMIREVNSRDPQLVSVSENAEIAGILRDKMANLINSVVDRGI